ncbi:MAG: hypothetical protein WDO17_26425 [Alphaproteobacteria bacterium]
MTLKSALIGATAIAIALTSFDLRPAAAAPQGGPMIAQQQSDATDFSAARKRRYRGNPGAPLAAFGAIVGTIGAIAAANSRREYYERPYYGGPAYGYYDAPAYQYQSAPVYQHRGYPQRDYYSRWGGSGGQPGYHGPNVNVPGATNYGNAAGQNGQAPPLSPSNSQNAGGSN